LQSTLQSRSVLFEKVLGRTLANQPPDVSYATSRLQVVSAMLQGAILAPMTTMRLPPIRYRSLIWHWR
jgi:hypothetical protein